jgi:hypothetical protein
VIETAFRSGAADEHPLLPRRINGFPMPDAAWLEKLQASGPIPHPSDDDLRRLFTKLLWAAELERRGKDDATLPPGMTAVDYLIEAMIEFLQNVWGRPRPDLDLTPLYRLFGAVADLKAGRRSALFEPVERPAHAPPKPLQAALIWGYAAKCCDLLTRKCGVQRREAAERVAAALNADTGKTRVSANTVLNMRTRCCRQDQTAPERTITAFNDCLSDFNDPSPKVQAEWLLTRIRGKAREL